MSEIKKIQQQDQESEVKVHFLPNSSPPSWKIDILQQIKTRNKTQSRSFQEIILNYEKLLVSKRDLENQNREFEKEISHLTEMNREHQRGDPKLIESLEKKIHTLQEDLTVSYKTSAENANKILEMTNQVKELEEENKSKDMQIEELKAAVDELRNMCKKYEEELTQKTISLELQTEEIKILQSERESHEKLKKEYDVLVDRCLKMKEEQVEKLNEINQLNEEIFRASQRVSLQEKVGQISVPEEPHKGGVLSDIEHQFVMGPSVLPKKMTRVLEAHEGGVHSAAFSSSGSWIASGGNDNTVKIWEARGGYLQATLTGAIAGIMSVSFSPNEAFIVASSNDTSVRLWSVPQRRIKHILTGHSGKVLSSMFTSDSNRVVSGSHDRTVKIWDLTKGYCIRTIFCNSSCNALALALEGRMVISGHFDHVLRFWESRNGNKETEITSIHKGQITSVCISPDERYVLTNSRDNTLKLVDIRTYGIVRAYRNDQYRNGVNWNFASFSPDGKWIAAGSENGSVQIWAVETGNSEPTLKSPRSEIVSCCVWNPTANQFLTTDKGGCLCIWGPQEEKK